MTALLETRDLSMRFGGLLAVDGVSLQIQEKTITSVIGPNGAGKTTLFNCISGFYQPTSGQVFLDSQTIQGKPSHKIARLGLVRTFQNVRLFKNMTALENMLVAQHAHIDTRLLSGLLKLASFRKSETNAVERAMHWLNLLGLGDIANQEAGNLAYGQQRRLEIARCMVTEPKLIMLDEPAAGLNPQETKELDQFIIKLRDEQGVTVLLIEHDMNLVMGISDYIYVIDQGRPLASGLPKEVRENPAVINAYLGES